MRSLFDRELRWFDHYVKGEDNGIDKEPPVEIFFMGVNKWKHAADWPLPGTRYAPYHLAAGGKLSEGAPSGGESDQYTYDPDSPVPTVGGNNCCGTPTIAGPRDQREIEKRPDVLGYTSEPLTRPLAIAGPVKMLLHASTDGRDTDWSVKLIDVRPDGFAMNIAEGILRARFRKGLDRMELLTPGQVYEFEIGMAGTANVFLPGHRIRVDIASANFPQFDRNPNTGEDLGVSAKTRVARQTIYHSAARPSRIVLPVVQAP
jgi:putative CocE/NonD family hydrolase